MLDFILKLKKALGEKETIENEFVTTAVYQIKDSFKDMFERIKKELS